MAPARNFAVQREAISGKWSLLWGVLLLLGCGRTPPRETEPAALRNRPSPDVLRRIDRLVREGAARWDLSDCLLQPRHLRSLAEKSFPQVRCLRLGRYEAERVPRWQWLLRFVRLEELYLGQVPLDDRGLEAAGNLSGLRVLNAGRAPGVSDRGLEHLVRLENLQLLRLAHCRVGARGLRAIARLPQLKALILDDVPLDRDCWRVLRSMKQLDSLYLYRTGLSEQELAELQEVVPHVHW